MARVAEIPTQQMAGLSNDEHIRALQGVDFEAMKAYFADLKGYRVMIIRASSLSTQTLTQQYAF